MPISIRSSIIAVVISFGLSGCCLFAPSGIDEQLTASQLRSQELYAENGQLMMAEQNGQQVIAGLNQERQMLVQKLGQVETQLSTANTRIDNLLAERGQIKDRYAALLSDTSSDPLVTSGPAGTPNLPGFTRDELTGLNKYPEDVLFDLGSAELRPESLLVLKEFANEANSPSTDGMRILIVGHTDDQVIARGATAVKHPTNWHLSTDRADQVILELERLGVDSERIASMGYSKFQPLETSTDEATRQRNRRVEMYIVPDSANLAIWDPVRSLK